MTSRNRRMSMRFDFRWGSKALCQESFIYITLYNCYIFYYILFKSYITTFSIISTFKQINKIKSTQGLKFFFFLFLILPFFPYSFLPFLIKLIFKSCFRFTAKLNGRHRGNSASTYAQLPTLSESCTIVAHETLTTDKNKLCTSSFIAFFFIVLSLLESFPPWFNATVLHVVPNQERRKRRNGLLDFPKETMPLTKEKKLQEYTMNK